MKTIFLLLIIYNLQYFTDSHDASTIIYKSYPKKVHPDREHLKVLNAGSYYKKQGKGKSFTRFRPPAPSLREWAAQNNKKNAAASDASLFPIDFQGDLKSRVKKVPYFNDKELRRNKRAVNDTKPDVTTTASTTPPPKVETTKADAKPVAAVAPNNVSISRRSVQKNAKVPARSRSSKNSTKRPKPVNVVRLEDSKASRSRSAQKSGVKKNQSNKRALRKRKLRSRVERAGKNQPQTRKGDKEAVKKANKPVGKGAARQGAKRPNKSPRKLRSQNKPAPKARRPAASRRLIAARDARPEDYPYMVSIQKEGVHWCSGAILNPQLIISTANCFWKSNAVSRMKIRVGARSIDTGGQVAYIAEVRKHPGWSIRKDPENDVALALLDRQLRFSDTVHGVDLGNIMMKPPFDDVWVTSYGAERRDGVFSRLRLTLQVAYMRTMSDAKCNNITTRFGIPLPDSFFCLEQVGRRAPCTRDTGAPAVSDGILWGVASWGIRKLCGTVRFPAMFTDLTAPTVLEFLINATTHMMGEERQSPFLDRLEYLRLKPPPEKKVAISEIPDAKPPKF